MQGCGRGACARTVVRGSGGGGCGVPVTVRSGSGCGGSLSDKPPASRGKAGSAGPASAGESAPDLGAFGSVNDDRAMARTLDRTFRGEGAHPGSPCRVGGAQLPAACPSPDGPPHGAPPPPPEYRDLHELFGSKRFYSKSLGGVNGCGPRAIIPEIFVISNRLWEKPRLLRVPPRARRAGMGPTGRAGRRLPPAWSGCTEASLRAAKCVCRPCPGPNGTWFQRNFGNCCYYCSYKLDLQSWASDGVLSAHPQGGQVEEAPSGRRALAGGGKGFPTGLLPAAERCSRELPVPVPCVKCLAGGPPHCRVCGKPQLPRLSSLPAPVVFLCRIQAWFFRLRWKVSLQVW